MGVGFHILESDGSIGVLSSVCLPKETLDCLVRSGKKVTSCLESSGQDLCASDGVMLAVAPVFFVGCAGTTFTDIFLWFRMGEDNVDYDGCTIIVDDEVSTYRDASGSGSVVENVGCRVRLGLIAMVDKLGFPQDLTKGTGLVERMVKSAVDIMVPFAAHPLQVGAGVRVVEELLRSGDKFLAAAADASLVRDGETSTHGDSVLEVLIAHGGVVGGHKLTATGPTRKDLFFTKYIPLAPKSGVVSLMGAG